MPAQFKDYYATLGVSRDATPEEIKKSFRKLARQYHPDTAKNKKVAEEKFKEINEANEVLGDPEKRKQYDEMRRLIVSRDIYSVYDKWFAKPIPPKNTPLNLPVSYLLRDFWKYPTDQVPF